MEKLDRLGWAAGMSLNAYGVRVGVRVNDPSAMERLSDRLPPGWKPAPAPLVERLGVPGGAIRLLAESVWNTTDEVRLIARELAAGGTGGVILVTSKTHSRRVRATWSAVVGPSPRATVRYASEEPFDNGQWWRHTRDALDVSREVFGLMNVWAGFPVQPDRGQR